VKLHESKGKSASHAAALRPVLVNVHETLNRGIPGILELGMLRAPSAQIVCESAKALMILICTSAAIPSGAFP
jgi:hypothetical protein